MTARIARMVNTDAKAYIFPGDSPMIREDVGGQEQKWLQRQKTDCRPATVNLGQTQIERIYKSFSRVHMRKREEGGSIKRPQSSKAILAGMQPNRYQKSHLNILADC